MNKSLAVILLIGISFIAMRTAPAANLQSEPVIFSNDSMRWTDCPTMPAGCKMVILYGDTKKTEEFAVRFKYPAKYRIGPHTHASDEHVTVISGGPFHLVVGDKFDDGAPSGKTLHVGDLAVVPAGTQHFAWMENETVLQVNGIGPFKRDFIDPANKSSGVPN
ncbi:MAG: cupin domain-containing protein [Acidobacteriota bacterium]|nr:cupin domain-containing protein [Acidobacteriota bacterium]